MAPNLVRVFKTEAKKSLGNASFTLYRLLFLRMYSIASITLELGGRLSVPHRRRTLFVVACIARCMIVKFKPPMSLPINAVPALMLAIHWKSSLNGGNNLFKISCTLKVCGMMLIVKGIGKNGYKGARIVPVKGGKTYE